MTLRTRKPTGKPSWPILLIAGVEKSGKTYSAAAASGSDLIGRTFWIGVGEDDPDEYGAVPGADFEIVEHDGTYRGILTALTEASNEPPTHGRPNLLVLDSGTRLWNLLSDAAQATANERARKKGRSVGEDGADISVDLWNNANQRWGHLLDTCRGHPGPVIITARLDMVMIVDGEGKPTKDKVWKVQSQKHLPYDVGAIVQFRAFGEAYLTGVRSLKFRPKPQEVTRLDEFTVDGLWRNLGLGDGDATSPRQYSAAKGMGETAERDELMAQVAAAAARHAVPRHAVQEAWARDHNGQPIEEATDLGGLELLRDDLLRGDFLNVRPAEQSTPSASPDLQGAPDPERPAPAEPSPAHPDEAPATAQALADAASRVRSITSLKAVYEQGKKAGLLGEQIAVNKDGEVDTLVHHIAVKKSRLEPREEAS